MSIRVVMQTGNALTTLHGMNFKARVIQGHDKDIKEIAWITPEGFLKSKQFTRWTSWEGIIEYAKQLIPYCDRVNLYMPGDIIEFTWGGKLNQGTILDIDWNNCRYLIETQGRSYFFSSHDLIAGDTCLISVIEF